MTGKQFYIEFGKIVYAIAMADGDIQKEEKDALYAMVKEELAPIEAVKDSFGTDLSFYTLFSFETEEEVVHDSVEDAMNSFFQFMKTHKFKLNAELSKACSNILRKVAKAHGRVTNIETEILEKFDSRMAQHA